MGMLEAPPKVLGLAGERIPERLSKMQGENAQKEARALRCSGLNTSKNRAGRPWKRPQSWPSGCYNMSLLDGIR